MRLRRIQIAHFRKLTGPVVLDGLGDGLVVIAGDNEEGKSTILAALKAAFFEHHQVGGSVREAMAPLRGGVPEIAVSFEVGFELWQRKNGQSAVPEACRSERSYELSRVEGRSIVRETAQLPHALLPFTAPHQGGR